MKDWAVTYFIENGAPSDQILLGLASYGKSFTWENPPYGIRLKNIIAFFKLEKFFSFRWDCHIFWLAILSRNMY
jgi:hypothetical protein